VSREEKANIEPFFKYFCVSKNILFSMLVITFPSAILLEYLLKPREFSLSNPSIPLSFFLILFLCEKLSIWLDKKIKGFLIVSQNDPFTKKRNFIERFHNYQFQNQFNLKF
jgi:hypothetical protein